jgi:hypothetical protein
MPRHDGHRYGRGPSGSFGLRSKGVIRLDREDVGHRLRVVREVQPMPGTDFEYAPRQSGNQPLAMLTGAATLQHSGQPHVQPGEVRMLEVGTGHPYRRYMVISRRPRAMTAVTRSAAGIGRLAVSSATMCAKTAAVK